MNFCELVIRWLLQNILFISQELNFDLRIGDLIMAINQEYINDVEQFDNVYEKIKSGNKKNVVLLVRRREFTMFVAMPIK